MPSGGVNTSAAALRQGIGVTLLTIKISSKSYDFFRMFSFEK
jgi:hypothetical protein